MRASVREVFFDYTAGREGFTPFMYCDTLNLVTTGVGNLIDAGPRNGFDISAKAMAPAMGLPWKFKAPGWTSKNPVAGERASQEEIREAWTRTKLKEQESPGFNQKGGFAYAGFQPLTLDLEALKTLFNKTLTSFDASLSKHYPGYEVWPADAQLAILSMSWAMGPAFHPALGFSSFFNAVNAEDFEAAKAASVFKGGGALEDESKPPRDAKLISRNAAHQIMFQNAANVVKGGGDRDLVFFPISGGPATPATVPAGRGGIANISGKAPILGAATFGVAGAGILGWGLYEYLKGRKKR